jgi:AAA domain
VTRRLAHSLITEWAGLQAITTFEQREKESGGAGMGDTERRTSVKTFAEIEDIEQEWLWPGMIPAGLLTVIFGPPKVSKTTMLCDYAARVSRGDVNPDGTSLGPAAPVLFGALEDITESSTIKRLRAARCDDAMIVDISKGPDGDGLELSLDHVDWLYEVAEDFPGAALIVIDTLSTSATRPITTRPGLKAMLKPLNKIAENTGAGVILTAHSLKNHDDIPEGGRSLVSIPRQVLTIQKSKDEPGVKTLSVYASNITGDGEGYRYKLTGAGTDSTIEWGWDVPKNAAGPEAAGQGRILFLLRNSPPMSSKLIAKKVGMNYGVARVLITKLSRRGLIEPGLIPGTWTVPEAERMAC